ncbi:MAG: hypothetical protein ACI9Z7_000689, partial [Alteromonas macleodii]
MTNFRYFLLALFMLISSVILAQEKTKVKGVITDGQSGEPLPFVNVAFVGKNVGTTTDFNGKYQMDTKWGSDKVQASFVGYELMEKIVVQGQTNTINFKLEPTQIKLDEVVIKAKGRYKNKENPAVALIQKVVDNRDKNRKEGFDHYQYDKYEKMQL